MDEHTSPAGPFDGDRRWLLRAVGGAGLVGLAGCTGSGDDEESSDDADDQTAHAAAFELSDFDPGDVEVDLNETLSVSVTVSNVGEREGEADVDYRIGTDTVESTSVRLAGGDSADVLFDGIELTEHGEFTHGFYLDGDERTGTLDVAWADPFDPDEYVPGYAPSDALDTFELADGFEIELVASEPLVDSPVDVKWDAKGRMWVVEMPDYLAHSAADEEGEANLEIQEPYDPDHPEWGDPDTLHGWGDETTDEEPNGAIKILEDVDGDGVYEEATAFLDGLTLPRSIGFVDGDATKAIVAQAGGHTDEPDLVVAEDTNGNLRADRVHTLKEDWVNDVLVEHTHNGLDFMLDNWLYNARSTDRFQYRDGELIEARSQFRGQWGITQDEWGRIVTGQNHFWIKVDLPPANGEYLLRGGYDSSTGVDVELISPTEVQPVRENYGTNRSYEGDFFRLDEHGRLTEPRSCAGPGAYRDDLFPTEMRNNIFAPDAKTNTVARFELLPDDDELELGYEHHWYDHDQFEHQEFLASTDEVFRPVNVKTGPDGALYVVDMYHGLFQHHPYLTTYLANYYLVNGLHAIPPAGRIYRIYPTGESPKEIPDLTEKTPDELAACLDDQNGWVRDTAKRLIVQNPVADAAPGARDVARESDFPQGRIHALWALHGIDEIDWETVEPNLGHENPYVVEHAIRTGEQLLGTDDAEAYVETVADLTEHETFRVAVQAAYSLGEVADDSLQELARPAMEALLEDHAGNAHVEDAVHSSPEMDF